MKSLLVALLLALPLSAQTELRGGVRTGVVHTKGPGVGIDFGGELWVARGIFAGAVALDHYEVFGEEGVTVPQRVTIGAIDANLRTPGRRYVWLGVSPQSLYSAGENEFDLGMNAGFASPWGARELYVTVRRHGARIPEGREFLRAEGVMFLVGIRSGNFF
jgi:hypothetical protein